MSNFPRRLALKCSVFWITKTFVIAPRYVDYTAHLLFSLVSWHWLFSVWDRWVGVGMLLPVMKFCGSEFARNMDLRKNSSWGWKLQSLYCTNIYSACSIAWLVLQQEAVGKMLFGVTLSRLRSWGETGGYSWPFHIPSYVPILKTLGLLEQERRCQTQELQYPQRSVLCHANSDGSQVIAG